MNARVLVADDDPDLLEAVAQVLERNGAEVVRARSGDELVRLMAAQGPFALVITDVSMPWMSGLEVVRSTRHAGLHAPVIVMTALPTEQVATRVSELGHDAVLLHKPFGVAELLGTATRLLEEARDDAIRHD